MIPETPFVPLTGRCRCELVRFRIEAAPMITQACFCRLCQRFGGSAFCTFSMIETSHLTLESGPTVIVQGAKSHKQVQCAECRCALWVHRQDLGDGIAFVGVGTLDEPERLPPEVFYFVRSKFPWITLPPDVPAFDTFGDPGKSGIRERIMAALARGGAPPLAGDWAREAPMT